MNDVRNEPAHEFERCKLKSQSSNHATLLDLVLNPLILPFSALRASQSSIQRRFPLRRERR
jgi:hypothetical protein